MCRTPRLGRNRDQKFLVAEVQLGLKTLVGYKGFKDIKADQQLSWFQIDLSTPALTTVMVAQAMLRVS